MYAYKEYVKTCMKWYKDIDFRGYTTLSFYAKKIQNHGGIYIEIGDGSDGQWEFAKSYQDLNYEWAKYEVDISNFADGIHTLNIIGGYVDGSGSRSSNTLYADIKLY